MKSSGNSSVRKISIVVASLAKPGGAERVATWLANSWSGAGVDVSLIALGMGAERTFFPLSSSVRLRPIPSEPSAPGFLGPMPLFLSEVARLRRVLKGLKPDFIVSFLDTINVMTLLASRGMASRVVVSERTDPHGRRIPYRWELLRRLTYPWADGLVVQSDHALSFFADRVRSRGRVIPNPVLLPEGVLGATRASGSPRPKKVLMGLGSLRAVKGFDRLIEAFSRIAANHPEWNLCIYGEGPCRPELEKQIHDLRMADRIQLPGMTREHYARLRDADLFVLSSRNEGFPNALAEAMACGLPVISFDCDSGPRDLIRHGVDGLLVPNGDVRGLATQLGHLMGDPVARDSLARRAPEVLERFRPDRVLALWDQMVNEANTRTAGCSRHQAGRRPFGAAARAWPALPERLDHD